MSIITTHTIQCDECGRIDPYNTANLRPIEVRINAIARGWHYMRRPVDARGYWDGRMIDLCPDCWAKRQAKEEKG